MTQPATNPRPKSRKHPKTQTKNFPAEKRETTLTNLRNYFTVFLNYSRRFGRPVATNPSPKPKKKTKTTCSKALTQQLLLHQEIHLG
jgi:hypothetical protein